MGLTFSGMTKFTTVDYPGKLACVLYLPTCLLRCPYCHNKAIAQGSRGEGLTEDDVKAFLKRRRGKLTGVVLSGGDPLCSPMYRLSSFIEDVKGMGFSVKLDTAGVAHALTDVATLGMLDAIAIDLKLPPGRILKFMPQLRCSSDFPNAEVLQAFGRKAEETLRMNIALLNIGRYSYKELRTTVHKSLLSEDDLIAIRDAYVTGDVPWYLQQYVPCDGFNPELKDRPTYTDDELKAIAGRLGAKVRNIKEN